MNNNYRPRGVLGMSYPQRLPTSHPSPTPNEHTSPNTTDTGNAACPPPNNSHTYSDAAPHGGFVPGWFKQ